MKKFLLVLLISLTYNNLLSKTLVLNCKTLDASFFGTEVTIDTNAEFVSMNQWIIKGQFDYMPSSGIIEAFGVISEFGNNADFRHVKYYEKQNILAFTDSFYRPRGVSDMYNKPHKYVSKGEMAVYECKKR